VQLFAAPYAKRAPVEGEVEAAPAAAKKGDIWEWGGVEILSRASGLQRPFYCDYPTDYRELNPPRVKPLESSGTLP